MARGWLLKLLFKDTKHVPKLEELLVIRLLIEMFVFKAFALNLMPVLECLSGTYQLLVTGNYGQAHRIIHSPGLVTFIGFV